MYLFSVDVVFLVFCLFMPFYVRAFFCFQFCLLANGFCADIER